MHELELSSEARELEPEVVEPEHARLAWNDFAHGRGLLLLCAAAGVCGFFCPWVEVLIPENMVLRGFDLARGNAGWLWGGATGFFVLLPLIWTRRTLASLRGARVIATLFAALTWIEVAVLLARPPRRGLLPLELSWAWGLYASAAVSLLATLVAVRLGSPLFRGAPRRGAPLELADGVEPEEPAPPSSNQRVLH
jgi:hypothetical protein